MKVLNFIVQKNTEYNRVSIRAQNGVRIIVRTSGEGANE